CAECHFRLHGAPYPLANADSSVGVVQTISGSRLVNFSPNVRGPATGGPPRFVKTAVGGQCFLRCHGQDHDPKNY
ncbi:MAG: hypothetical protein WCI22_18605, partial [Actinomycetota bacterium]